jgi:hypothetical protein
MRFPQLLLGFASENPCPPNASRGRHQSFGWHARVGLSLRVDSTSNSTRMRPAAPSRWTRRLALEVLEERTYAGGPVHLVPLFLGGSSLAAASRSLIVSADVIGRTVGEVSNTSAPRRDPIGAREEGAIAPDPTLPMRRSGGGVRASAYLGAGLGAESAAGRRADAAVAAPTARPTPAAWAGLWARTSLPNLMAQASDRWMGGAGPFSRSVSTGTASGAKSVSTAAADGSWPVLAGLMGTAAQPVGGFSSGVEATAGGATSAGSATSSTSAVRPPAPPTPTLPTPPAPTPPGALAPTPLAQGSGPIILPSSSVTLVGTWSRVSSGGYNNEAFYDHAAGTGTNKATWQFTGLTAGATYYPALTWLASGNRATSTPWTMYDSDGTTVLGTGTTNQQAVAVGPQAGGVNFQWFSSGFTPTGTSLTITISDKANGYVVADAAYLEPASDPGLVCSAIATGNWSAAATWAPYQPCVPYAITNCVSSGGQIEIKTASVNNWVTGNTINIIGVQGTTDANGAWPITVVDPTDAILVGSSFINTYTGGGSAFRGDSVAIGSGVKLTLDAAACDSNGLIIVGSNPNTGGTAAISWPASVSATTTLTINGGLTLRIRGDLSQIGGTNGVTGTLTMAAGSSLIFDPPSGQRYNWNLTNSVRFVSNGTSSSHCTVDTDLSRGGSPCGMKITGLSNILAGRTWGGLTTCTYTDFTNFGQTAGNVYGLFTYANIHYDDTIPNVLIQNCTFNACNYWLLGEEDPNALGNYTFDSNVFSNAATITSTLSPAFTYEVAFSDVISNTSYTRKVTNNGFDGPWVWDAMKNTYFTGNVVGGGVNNFQGSWPDTTYFNNNFISTSRQLAPTTSMPMANCYFYWPASANAHATFLSIPGGTVDDMIFDQPSAPGPGQAAGYCIISTGQVTVTRCLAIPGVSTGYGIGPLVAVDSHSGATIEHNLIWDSTAVRIGANITAAAGDIASFRSNLVVSPSATTNYAIMEGPRSTYTLDAVTVAGYNGLLNPTTGTSKCNGVSQKTPGYNQLAVSPAGFPNSSLGTGDITADPQFVDTNYRSMQGWANRIGGTANTAAAALAYLVANPSLVSQMMYWVRAGYAPTNPTYQNATYPGDAMKTDANGNPLQGTLGPMAFTP